jgi:hypothetical protein
VKLYLRKNEDAGDRKGRENVRNRQRKKDRQIDKKERERKRDYDIKSECTRVWNLETNRKWERERERVCGKRKWERERERERESERGKRKWERIAWENKREKDSANYGK